MGAILLVGLLAPGCGAGGGGAGDGGHLGGGIEGNEDGGSAGPLPDGAVVTEIELGAPSLDEFVVQATIPVPRGVYPQANGMVPFQIEDYDGTLVDTQMETVTRYPGTQGDADVVEVLGRVHRDPSVADGVHVRYRVIRHDQAPPTDPGSPGIEDLENGPTGVPVDVQDLLSDPTAIRISTADCFGNEYACYPLDGSGPQKLERYGTSMTQLRTYQTMMPEPAVSGSQGTLPHFFGVHSYLATLAGEEVIGLDLRFNNAQAGRDKSDVRDDPLDKVYFDHIDVTVPNGWVVIQDVKDPYFGDPYTTSSGDTAYPIVKSLGDGTFHVIRWQGQFHRRLMIAPVADGPTAYAYLSMAGQGFCRRGTDANLGTEYYSWWNQGTARYYPQSFQLPNLDHVPNISQKINDAFVFVRDHLLDGTGDGMYPIQSAVLGWGHPWGVPYGGMTSGSEIYIFDGVDVAEAANNAGMRMYRLVHRMHTDRQPNALYDADGTPSTVEDWLVKVDGVNDYVPFDHYIVPYFNNGDPFGLNQAPQFQIDYVQNNGLQPYYEHDHFDYQPHDYQHYVRYAHAAKALIWLGNDPLAKDDMMLVGEMFRLSYHPYYNSANGNVQGSGLRAQMNLVAAMPGTGSPFGRGEAWSTDVVVTDYAVGDDAFRARVRPWIDQVVKTMGQAQMPCNGFIQSQTGSKFVGGKYRARQAIEHAITENMLRGTLMTVYKDADPAMQALTEDIMNGMFYGGVSDMAWRNGDPAPRTYTAIGPLDPTKPVWCRGSQIPEDGFDPGFENYQNWSSFAYAYERTGDPLFLSKATVESGGGDLLTNLKANYLKNIWNQAAIIALAERLNGDL